LSFLRKSSSGEEILCIFHFTPMTRPFYRLGVNSGGIWEVLLNTDASEFGGEDISPDKTHTAEAIPQHGRAFSLRLTLPPLSGLYLRRKAE
jgi:1,4-alpha-glucan branching enzyme